MFRRFALLAVLCAFIVLVFRAAPAPPPSSAAVGSMGRGPTIVLVHGLGSDANHWLPVARDLARDHRVVLVELPGHGLAPMARPFTLEQATLALDRAIAEQFRGPVVLVGHSVGGLVAAAEALRAPSRVRALVLVESALAPQMTKVQADSLLAMFDHDWQGTLHWVYASFGRDSAQGEALWAEASQVERVNMRAWIPVAISTDLSGEVAGLRMPVLAVVSPRTWEPGETWQHASAALGLARIPRLSAARIDSCGHFVMLDQPRVLSNAIRRFAAASESTVALR